MLWAIVSEYSLCYTIQKDQPLTFQYTSLCNIKVFIRSHMHKTSTKHIPLSVLCIWKALTGTNTITRLSVNVNQSPALVLIYSNVCLVSVSFCQVWQAGVVSSNFNSAENSLEHWFKLYIYFISIQSLWFLIFIMFRYSVCSCNCSTDNSDDEMSFTSPSASQQIVIKDAVITIMQISVHWLDLV